MSEQQSSGDGGWDDPGELADAEWDELQARWAKASEEGRAVEVSAFVISDQIPTLTADSPPTLWIRP